MTAKLKNLGKGSKGIGANHKLQLTVFHADLRIAKLLTFWAVASFEGEIEIKLELAQSLVQNLEVKTNEKGSFLVWNGKV